MASGPWAIILAGGIGRRLAGVTGGMPKQFWAPPGRRPLLAATVERIAPLVPAERVITVVGADQRVHADRIARHHPVGQLAYQPCDRGTATGILLGLIAIATRAPEATVIITPSDHGILSDTAWRGGLEAAVAVVDAAPDDIVLFGAEPTSAVGDYGWILPAPEEAPPGRALARLGRFVEKPPPDEARRLFEGGAVWNTMVVVGSARALLELFSRRMPAVTRVFAEALRRPATDRATFLAARYPELPTSDFSMEVLQRTPGLRLYTWPASVGWTDLGTPARLRSWLADPARRAAATRAPEPHTRTGS